jgi:hypothetical protein
MSGAADFGGPQKGGPGRRLLLFGAAGAVTAAVAVVALLGEYGAAKDPRSVAVTGPPCPSVSHAAFVEPLKADQIFEFFDVRFGRRFGGADCAEATTVGTFGMTTHPVCQFSSPAVLAIKTAKGMFYFEPGVGRVATVSIVDDTPRCVLASPYWSEYTRLVTTSVGAGEPPTTD